MPLPDHVQGHMSDFHLGTPVYSSDGHHVGDLERLLIKPDDWDIVAAVVKETRSFAHLRFHQGTALIEADVIVPMSAIASKSRDRIELNVSVPEVRKFPPYLEFGPPDFVPPQTETEGKRVAYSVMHVAGELGMGPALTPLRETANETPDEIEVRPGENVMLGHNGDKFGHVEDVLVEDGELTGIVVKPSGLFSHDVVVPIRFLERSDNLALFIKLTEDQITKLRRFE